MASSLHSKSARGVLGHVKPAPPLPNATDLTAQGQLPTVRNTDLTV